jgi:hypothetical protein
LFFLKTFAELILEQARTIGFLYTAEEQEILDTVARNNGKEWTERHAHLILEQARTIGFL